MNKKVSIFFGVLFSVVGLITLVMGILFTKNTVSFLTNYSSATGTVIELTTQASIGVGDSVEPTYSPTVSFIDSEGETIVFTSNVSSDPPTFSEGESVSVLYNKDNHQDAKVNTFYQIWLVPSGFLGMGLAFLVLGLLVLIGMMKLRNRGVASWYR